MDNTNLQRQIQDIQKQLATLQQGKTGGVLITQDALLPGIIKERHLVVGSGANEGDLVYSNNSGGFTNLGIGTAYQFLVVINGVPSWITFPQTGLAANIPSSGRFAGDQYLATDTLAFSVWTGSAWKSTILA